MSTEFVFEKATINANDRGVYLCIKLPFEAREPAREFVAALKEGKQYVANLHERKAKRSLDQNGYFWTLCNKLSAVLRIPPKEIYMEYIKDVGDNHKVIPVENKNLKREIETWEAQGIGFIVEDLGESKIKGYHNIREYYGSSTYDKAQMGRLLDLIIADCDENGIVTLSPEEIAKLGEEGV